MNDPSRNNFDLYVWVRLKVSTLWQAVWALKEKRDRLRGEAMTSRTVGRKLVRNHDADAADLDAERIKAEVIEAQKRDPPPLPVPPHQKDDEK